MTSRDVAALILWSCGEAASAYRVRVALGRAGWALSEILSGGVMNELLRRSSASGCSRRGAAYVDRWTARVSEARTRGLLGWLRREVRGHGTARVTPAWVEADETLALVSLPSFGESRVRVVFAVSGSNRNLCDSGCWCTGKVTHAVCCFVPLAKVRRRSRRKRARLTPLVAFAACYGQGSAGGPPALWVAKPTACDLVARAIGLDAADLGLVVKFLFVAATERGAARWSRLERAHKAGLRAEQIVRRLGPDNADQDDDELAIASMLFDEDLFDAHDLLSDSDQDLDEQPDSDADDDSDDGDDDSEDDDDDSEDDDGDSEDDDGDSEVEDDSEDDSEQEEGDEEESASEVEEAEEALRIGNYAVRDFPQLRGSDSSSKADLLHSWEGGITPRRLLQCTADRLEYLLPERRSSDLTRLAAALCNWADTSQQLLYDDDAVADACFAPLRVSRRNPAKLGYTYF